MLKSEYVQNVVACLILSIFAPFFAGSVLAKNDVHFLKGNVHTRSKSGPVYKTSYTNHTTPGAGHLIIPPGTEILITDRSRKSFTFKCDNETKEVVSEFHERQNR